MMQDVTVRQIERWPWVVVAILVVAALGALLALAGLWDTGDASWLQLAVLGFLLVLFVALAIIHIGIGRSRLTITANGITRSGPRSWTVTPTQVERLDLADGRLTITVTREASHSPMLARAISETRWFASGRRGQRSISTRLHPDDLARAQAALADCGPAGT